jgi:hypothetical protein
MNLSDVEATARRHDLMDLHISLRGSRVHVAAMRSGSKGWLCSDGGTLEEAIVGLRRADVAIDFAGPPEDDDLI